MKEEPRGSRKEDVRLAAAKAEDRLSSNNNCHQLI